MPAARAAGVPAAPKLKKERVDEVSDDEFMPAANPKEMDSYLDHLIGLNAEAASATAGTGAASSDTAIVPAAEPGTPALPAALVPARAAGGSRSSLEEGDDSAEAVLPAGYAQCKWLCGPSMPVSWTGWSHGGGVKAAWECKLCSNAARALSKI